MAEPVRNDEPLSSMRYPESPGSSVRPGPVPVERSIDYSNSQALLPETATEQSLGEWPHERHSSDFDQEHRSSGVANVLNTVKDKARQIPGFVSDRVEDLRYRFRLIRGRAKESDVADRIKDQASELADTASRQARFARNRAQYYARNYPLQFIAGSAATAFVVGFLLRVWRDE
ncbi:MAG TPA: hypothetical protein VN577_14465 [Terriglobales bacterium]|nr:hypothetical protein [Terriglobales bacterium]